MHRSKKPPGRLPNLTTLLSLASASYENGVSCSCYGMFNARNRRADVTQIVAR